MNERIEKLAEQAGMVRILNEHAHEYGNGMFENTLYPEMEKFAELIVKECGHCMVDIMLYGGIEPEQGYDIMLKHFGVEE